MILITGVTGSVGRAVLEQLQLIASVTPVNLAGMIRKPQDAATLRPNTRTVVADFADKASLAAALPGTHTLFLVCSPIPQLVEYESNVIDAAVGAGVQHVVLNSALGAADYQKSFPSWHRKVEDKLKATSLHYTILRPNGFMQNIPTYYGPTVKTQNAFYAAMDEAKISLIDVNDIAVVTAKILFNPEQHINQIYELNGPEALSYTNVAERLSTLTGRQINFVDIPNEAQRQAMLGLGMPDWQVTALLDLQDYYKTGAGGKITPTLETLLGRPPTLFNDYLATVKDAFTYAK